MILRASIIITAEFAENTENRTTPPVLALMKTRGSCEHFEEIEPLVALKVFHWNETRRMPYW
jgi:hypothetical protein